MSGTTVSGTPMSPDEFTSELDELIAAGREGGLPDEDIVALLERGDQGAAQGAIVAGGTRAVRHHRIERPAI
jgi:hypothetical protein